MLRNILLIFGWLIPIAVTLLLASDIYRAFHFESNSIALKDNLTLSIVRAIAGSIDDYALSPLCFFGAQLLRRKVK